jgi:hypothetical protein
MNDTDSSIDSDNYFAIIPEWVLYSKISANAVRLYCVLRRRADKQSGKCHPSRKTLAKEMGSVSENTVDRAKDELINIGALKVFHRMNGKEYTSNIYTVISNNPMQKLQGVGQKLQGVASDLKGGGFTDGEQTIVIKPESSNQRNTSFERNPEIVDLCSYLADAIGNRGLKPKPTQEQTKSDRWYSEMRLLFEGKIGKGDTRENSGPLTAEQIKTAIDWAMNDDFWAINILSPAKLRIQYPAMRMRAKMQQSKKPLKGDAYRLDVLARWGAIDQPMQGAINAN